MKLVSKKVIVEPILNKLKLDNSINKEEYKALCSGNRSAILYAFTVL